MLFTRSPAGRARAEARGPEGAPRRLVPAARPDVSEGITLSTLHERYVDDVFRYVSRRVPRREEAEDITAEVFAAAFVDLPRFRGQCAPYLWLLGIARRKIVDSLRRRAVRRETLASELPDVGPGGDPLPERPAAAEGPEEALERAEEQRVVRELVEQLNEDQREALLLQYVEGLSIAEIAAVLGRSPAATNSLLQRARAALFRRGHSYFLGEDEGRKP
jgi:RNA polymerase sigma-70 factor (ECF subfamily)